MRISYLHGQTIDRAEDFLLLYRKTEDGIEQRPLVLL